MNKLIYITTGILFFLVSNMAFSQNDPLGGKDTLTLENERVEDVIESEKPFIKLPYQELKNASKDQVKYDSRDFYVETDFQPAPPKIKKFEEPGSLQLFKNNMFKAGIGRFATPFASLYLNNGKEKNVDYGLEVGHISAHQDGPIPLRRFRRNNARLQASMVETDYTFNAVGNFLNTSYFNYAGTENLDNTTSLEDSLKMNYTHFDVDASILSNYDEDRDFEYDAGVALKLHNDRRKNNEFHFDLTPKGGYRVAPDIIAGADTRFNFVRGKINGNGQNRVFVEASPHIKYENGSLSIKGGVNFGQFSNSADSVNVSNIGPDIEVAYEIVPDEISIVGGINTRVIPNSYYQMIGENPYMDTNVEIKASREKLNVYGGLKGNLGQKVDFAVRGYHKQVENQLIYNNARDGRFFNVLYDSLTKITGLHAELNYNLEDEITAGAALNVNAYSTSTVDKFYHVSPFRLDVYGSYTWDKKLTVKGEVFVFGPRPMGLDSIGEVIRQSTFIDVNISGDYRITDGFSVFLEANNLLNTQYQRWQGYLERKLDFNAGVTFAF